MEWCVILIPVTGLEDTIYLFLLLKNPWQSLYRTYTLRSISAGASHSAQVCRIYKVLQFAHQTLQTLQ